MAHLSLLFLGPFQATLNGHVLTGFESNKVRALLAFLAVESDRPHARESLATLLWPNYLNHSAANNLRSVLANLRQILGDRSTDSPFLIITRETVQFNPNADYILDVDVFNAAVSTQGKQADLILDTYRGDFLEGFSLPDNSAFEEWLQGRREKLQQQMLAVLESLAANAMQQSAYSKVVTYARRQLEMDNLCESAYRQLMLALAHLGQRTEALAQYELCAHLLRVELNIEPSAETRALAQRIAAEEIDLDAKDATATITPTAGKSEARHNLSLQLSSFIGREREIAEVARLLDGYRLVTLTGVGGCGKSRLALEVARGRLPQYPDGTWLIELAPLTLPDLVLPTIAYTLGIRDQLEIPIIDALIEYLRSRSTLLIFDNCEHLIETCAFVSESLLKACPHLHILSTSREALSVSGETIYIVPPLEVPDLRHSLPLAKLAVVESVRLFVERAANIRSEFVLSDQNAMHIAQICQSLDGIPLVIELAAARVNTLSTIQIAERLDDRFQLLTNGRRTALPRHQTLRSMIDWSYDLLSPAEQQLLNRLSVFAGNFDMKAAEGVCTPILISTQNTFDSLTRLVTKSLVVVDSIREGGVRYLLHETIRQYASEKLEAAGEAEELKDHHARYYHELAIDLDESDKDPIEINRILDQEMGNFRAALRRLQAQERFEDLAQLCTILGEHWFIRGNLTEGKEWLDLVLDQRFALSLPIQGRVLMAKGKFSYESGKYHQAQENYRESLAIYRELGDAKSMAKILNLEGVAAMMMGYFSEAAEYHRQSLTEYRKLGVSRGIASNLNRLGFIAYCEKEFDSASKLVQESLTISSNEGDKLGEALALNGLGEIARARGEFKAAQILYEQALSIYQQFSEKYSIAVIRLNLAHTAYQLGDSQQSDRLFRESLVHFYELDNTKLCTLSLIGLALVAFSHGNYSKACTLLGALDVLIQDPSSVIVGPADQGVWEEAVTKTNALIEREELDKALENGRKMSLAEIVTFALG